jgi:hypothetical protein
MKGVIANRKDYAAAGRSDKEEFDRSNRQLSDQPVRR